MLYGPIRDARLARGEAEVANAGVAAWALVHGYATLLLNHNLPEPLARDPEAGARSIASYLFAGRSPFRRRPRQR